MSFPQNQNDRLIGGITLYFYGVVGPAASVRARKISCPSNEEIVVVVSEAGQEDSVPAGERAQGGIHVC